MSTINVPYTGFSFLPHQEVGVRWMIDREMSGDGICRGGILADDMGLGKTWQTIGLLTNCLVAKTLLVAPPVLISQWQEALDKSGVVTALFWDRKWKGADDASVYLVTYDKVWRNMKLMTERVWDRVVLDEGHFIRNAKTKRAQSLLQVRGDRKWVLSGTPVQNGLSDFRTLLDWLGYEVPRIGAMAACQELAKTVLLRRPITLLADVMPAPPTHEKETLVYGGGAEFNTFNVLVGRLQDAMSANYPSACILELYLRVQMFISHPQIYRDAMNRKYGGSYFSGPWQGTATKLAAFNTLLDADSVSPTLVFCNFKLEMDYVADAATAHGYKVYFIRGGMGGAERKHGISESIRLAQTGVPVLMICQIVAGNCGLNLQHLTRVIFYTQHWNPSVMDQAMTRSYRYGQKSEVTVHHLILGSPELRNIDRCMLEKHAEKRSLTFILCPSLKFAFHPEFAVPGAGGGGLLMPLSFEEEEEPEDPVE